MSFLDVVVISCACVRAITRPIYIYTSNRSALVCECKDLDGLGDDLKDFLDEDERRKTVVTVERVPH